MKLTDYAELQKKTLRLIMKLNQLDLTITRALQFEMVSYQDPGPPEQSEDSVAGIAKVYGLATAAMASLPRLRSKRGQPRTIAGRVRDDLAYRATAYADISSATVRRMGLTGRISDPWLRVLFLRSLRRVVEDLIIRWRDWS